MFISDERMFIGDEWLFRGDGTTPILHCQNDAITAYLSDCIVPADGGLPSRYTEAIHVTV